MKFNSAAARGELVIDHDAFQEWVSDGKAWRPLGYGRQPLSVRSIFYTYETVFLSYLRDNGVAGALWQAYQWRRNPVLQCHSQPYNNWCAQWMMACLARQRIEQPIDHLLDTGVTAAVTDASKWTGRP